MAPFLLFPGPYPGAEGAALAHQVVGGGLLEMAVGFAPDLYLGGAVHIFHVVVGVCLPVLFDGFLDKPTGLHPSETGTVQAAVPPEMAKRGLVEKAMLHAPDFYDVPGGCVEDLFIGISCAVNLSGSLFEFFCPDNEYFTAVGASADKEVLSR